MERQEFLTRVRRSRETIDALWMGVDETQLTARPGVDTDVSVKDLLAHLTFWEQNALEAIDPILAGKHREPLDVDAMNARVRAENANQPLAQVIDDYRSGFERLMARIERLSDADLQQSYRVGGAEFRLIDKLRGDTDEHYEEHIEALRAWRARIDG